MQLMSPMSLDMVKARFEWLVYNEPESHLDALARNEDKLADVLAGNRVRALRGLSSLQGASTTSMRAN